MALDKDEMNRRREKREQARARQRRQKRRLMAALVLAAVILAGCGTGIFFLVRKEKAVPVSGTLAVPETTEKETTAPTSGRVKADPITKIHIRAVGDLNITNSSVEALGSAPFKAVLISAGE